VRFSTRDRIQNRQIVSCSILECLFSGDAGALAVSYTNGLLEVWDIHRNLKRRWADSAGEMDQKPFSLPVANW
jgi:hypothetical protein